MNEHDFVIVEQSDVSLETESQPAAKQGETDAAVNNTSPTPLEQCQAWLSPTEYSAEGSEYRKHVQAHVPGTGNWLLSTDSFIEWQRSTDTGIFWLKGIPGSGKSVAAANLINVLSDMGKAPVLFFFFRNTIRMNSKPTFLVRDFLFQLLPHAPQLQPAVQRMMTTHPNIENASFQGLWNVLRSGLANLPRVFMVVDALDEIEAGQESFAGEFLLKLGRLEPQTIKLAITSRPLPDLEKAFKDMNMVSLRLSGRRVDEDIKTYIKYRLDQQQQREFSEQDILAIQDALCCKGGGLFLHSRLMLYELLQSNVPVQAHLERPLDSLSEIYQTLLHEQSIRAGVTQAFQAHILQWVTHSSRALRVIELAALAMSQKEFTSIQDAKSTIQICCAPLLEILDNETVQVIHHSFTEFLLDSNRCKESRLGQISAFPSFSPAAVHGVLAMGCVDYLLPGALKSSSQTFDFRRQGGQDLFGSPFLQYSSQNWSYHLRKSQSTNPHLFKKLDLLLGEGSPTLVDETISWESKMSRTWTKSLPGCETLHIASYFGLTAYTEYLLSNGRDANMREITGRTAIFFASEKGHWDIVKALLHYNANPDAADCLGLTAMHIAAINNRGSIVDLLASSGADPMAPKTNGETSKWVCSGCVYSVLGLGQEKKATTLFGGASINTAPQNKCLTLGETPLQFACELGSCDAIVALMAHLDVTTRKNIPLHWAADKGQSEALSILLKFPEVASNLDQRDRNGCTPLFLASKARNPDAVHILLESGANIHSVSEKITARGEPSKKRKRITPSCGMAPLHGWAQPEPDQHSTIDDIETVATLLIQAGCDVDVRDPKGQTALFSWASQMCLEGQQSERYERFVSTLLKHGANPKAVDFHGNTPLHMLRGDESEDAAIRLLIEAGASVNDVRTTDKGTPLFEAVRRSVFRMGADVINRFVGYGADFNMQDIDGNTPLHYLIKDSYATPDLLKSLLAVCDPRIKNRLRETCLFNASLQFLGWGIKNVLSLLLQNGVDLEQRNIFGRTALLEACRNGCVKAIPAFLDVGADATARDYKGKTCLHLLAKSPRPHFGPQAWNIEKLQHLMRRLIHAGADIRAVDLMGNSIFHDAADHDVASGENSDKILIIMKAVVQLGGITHSRNHDGRTALHITALKRTGRWIHEGGFDAARVEFLLQPTLGIEVSTEDCNGLTALHLAATVSDIMVWSLIFGGADIRAKTFEDRTPLHIASQAGLSNAVGIICDIYRQNSWSVNPQDTKGQTPLHEAARCGSLEAVRFLLDCGADPTSVDRRGRSPLHVAASFCKKQTIFDEERKFYDLKSFTFTPDLTQWKNSRWPNENMRLLQDESDRHNIRDVVRLLLEAGADPTILDYRGRNAYDIAIMNSCENLIEILASPLEGSGGETECSLRYPQNTMVENWFFLQKENVSNIIKILPLDEDQRNTFLEIAVYWRNEPLVEELLKLGDFPEGAGTRDEHTLIHTIASSGLVSMMKIFMSHTKDINSFLPPLLHVAADREASNLEMMRTLLALGANPNAYYQAEKELIFGALPNIRTRHTVAHKLAYGSYWWYSKALDILVDNGADLEHTDSNQRTCLQIALSQEHRKYGFWRDQSLDMLLTKGADVNHLDPEIGRTPLETALESGLGMKTVQKLLYHGADVSLGTNPPLISAISGANVENTRCMLKAGANPNGRFGPDGNKRTPLQVIGDAWTQCLLGSSERMAGLKSIIKLLLDHGADPYAEVYDSGLGGPTTAFHNLCYLNAPVTPFIAAGVDIEARDALGRTPLHAASSYYGYVGQGGLNFVAIELINARADINALDNHNRTHLHCAVQSEMDLTEIAYTLLQNGASANLRDDDGHNALYYVLRNSGYNEEQKVDLVESLEEAGADLNDVSKDDEEGNLHILARMMASLLPTIGAACEDPTYERFTSLYRRFIGAGCSPEARDKQGNTPAFSFVARAKKSGLYGFATEPTSLDLESCRHFLEYHDILAVNDEGETLLHVIAKRQENNARKGDGAALFKLLIEMGADPKRENKQGFSPLDTAAVCGKQEILDLFESDA